MLPHHALLVLLTGMSLGAVTLVGCTRSFSSPAVLPTVSSMSLVGGGPLEPAQVVLVGEAIALHGEQLAGATVQVGGVPAATQTENDGSQVFVVPAPATPGATLDVTVQAGSTSLVAGELTVYGIPSLGSASSVQGVAGEPDGGAQVLAPSLAVIAGANFSPRAEEDVVLFEGARAQVIVADPERLLVSLEASVQPGPVDLSVTLVPDYPIPGASRVAAQLATSRGAYVWEALPSMWFSPSAAFGSQVITLRPGGFPTALGAQLDAYGQFASSAGGDGGAQFVAPLTLPYVPDLGVPFNTALQLTNGAGDADDQLQVCIDAVPTDAIQVQFSQDGQLWGFQLPASYPAGTHQVQLQDPESTSGAAPLIGLEGHPPSPSLTCFPLGNWVGTDILPEPLPTAASEGTQLGVFFPSLDGGAVDCTGARVSSGGSVHLARYEPGGALDDPFCQPIPASAVASFTSFPNHTLGAGRHRLYLSDRQSSPLLVVSSLVPSASTSPPLVIDPASNSGLIPVAIQEPTLDDPYLWVVSANPDPPLTTVSLAAWALTADPASTPPLQPGSITSFIGPGDPPCANPTLVAAAFVGEVLNLAIKCDSASNPGFHELSLGRLQPPNPEAPNGTAPDGGATAGGNPDGGGAGLTPVWRRITPDPTLLGPGWTAQLGLGTVLLVSDPPDTQRPAVIISDNFIHDDPFGFPLAPVPGETLDIASTALSPDGQQALVVPTGGARVEIFEPQTLVGSDIPLWRQFGSFSVPTGSRAGSAVYDASGSQAIVLLEGILPDGGASTSGAIGGYCVLH